MAVAKSGWRRKVAQSVPKSRKASAPKFRKRGDNVVRRIKDAPAHQVVKDGAGYSVLEIDWNRGGVNKRKLVASFAKEQDAERLAVSMMARAAEGDDSDGDD